MAEVENGTASPLELRRISKTFGSTRALREVTVSARTGEVHAIVGENGAGKSTLMKIAAGVHQPDSGEIVVNGRPVRFRNPHDAIAHGISMIYQELNLAPHLTAAENIFLGREPRSRLRFLLDQSALEEDARKLLKSHGFELDLSREVHRLSPAERQIVEILKALAARSKVLIMDEPTSSLSEAESERLMEIIRQLRERGVAIFYISHRLEEVKRIADYITVLRDGEKVAEGKNEELDINTIVRHMVGREMREYYPPRDVELGEVVFRAENLSRAGAFSDISFEVRAGQVVGIAGLVGAGRTELVESIFGVNPPDTGRIFLSGEEITIRSPRDAVRHGIGLLTEDRKRSGLCLHLPLSWNITLSSLASLLRYGFIMRGEERRVAEQFIERLRIHGATADRTVGLLSGGNQQKVVLGRWLFRDCRFLMLDEPTRGIDVGAKHDVYLLINELARAGKAILMVSSELPELLGMCDVILVMHRGRIVAKLETKSTSAEEVMHYAAVGRSADEVSPTDKRSS